MSILIGRLSKTLSIIRLKPFDTSTADGRSNERLRRVFWTALTSALAKGINTIGVFITVPITLAYLGTERYGLWMAITSLIAFLGFADLGLGNGVLNYISDSTGKNDNQLPRKVIASSLLLLLGISLGLWIIFLIINPFIKWDIFFNISSTIAIKEAGPAITAFIICFLINLPLSIIPRIQMGYQEGYVNSIWQAISNFIGLAGLLIAVYYKVGLVWLVIIATGSPAIGNFLNGISLFLFQRKWLIPKFSDIDIPLAKKIVGIGFFFLILQATNAINYSADNVIIARVLGPEDVTAYAVPTKLFALIPTILYMALAPLWPAYGEAIARGDTRWAKKTLIRTVILIFLICSLSSGFLIILGKWILQVWTDSKVIYSFPLMFSLGIWTIIQTEITAFSLFLNALNKISFQAIFALITAFFSIILRIIFAKYFDLPGIVWGSIITSIGIMLIPYIIFLSNKFRKLSDLQIS